MAITVSIVEDHRGTREGLAAMIAADPELRCVGVHASGEIAEEAILKERPEVAIVDINLPGMDGVECVSRLKAKLPALHILMLTTYLQSDIIFASLRAGASGYLLKSTPRAELLQAIRDIQAGGAPMSAQIARRVVQHFHGLEQSAPELDRLSQREHEVLACLAKGFLYKEIGAELGISLNTVRMHLRSIYEKLHVKSRTEATAKFLVRP